MRRAAEAEARASAAAGSRAERRRLAELEDKQRSSRASMWRAWWLYPLVALIGVFVYLGLQEGKDAPPATPPIVQITDAP